MNNTNKNFTIRTSEEVDYSDMPGGSVFPGENLIYNIKETEITNIEKEAEDTIRVDLFNKEKSDKHGWIRTKTDEGKKLLVIIIKNKNQFIGKSYDDFINHQFTLTDEQ